MPKPEPTSAISIAEWRGTVRESLSSLKATVAQLNATSATKADVQASSLAVEEIRRQMERFMQSMETTITTAIRNLPCTTQHQQITTNEREIAKLGVAFKIKSSIWGILGGSLPALIGLAYLLLQKHG